MLQYLLQYLAFHQFSFSSSSFFFKIFFIFILITLAFLVLSIFRGENEVLFEFYMIQPSLRCIAKETLGMMPRNFYLFIYYHP